MPDEGRADGWSDILARRLVEEAEQPPAVEGKTAAAEERAAESRPGPVAETAPAAGQGGGPGAPGTGPGGTPGRRAADAVLEADPAAHRPPRPPRPSPPTSAIPGPATGPHGHYAGTVRGRRSRPLDSLGPAYGGITTGWKVPTTGGPPVAGAFPPGGTPAPAATTAQLVVRKLTRQLSTREETRALDILRGRGGSGSGLALALIMALAAGAVFAGTYLWTQAARESGVFLATERGVRTPEETREQTAERPALAPAPVGVASGVSGVSQGDGNAAVQRRGLRMRPSVAPARESGPKATQTVRQATGEGTPPLPAHPAVSTELPPARPLPTGRRVIGEDVTGEDVTREDLAEQGDEGAVFTLGPALGARSRTDEWVDLGGPLFGGSPAGPSAPRRPDIRRTRPTGRVEKHTDRER